MIKRWAKSIARKMGYVISAYDSARDPLAVRNSLFRQMGISVVFDVGANTGQYGHDLRKAGYHGRIISFEPLAAAYRQLSESAATDPQWTACNFALGEREGTAEIFISRNSWSSSMLDMRDELIQAAPDSKYVNKEMISIRTLDSVFNKHVAENDGVFLKIDTQGYTRQVLSGASDSIGRIRGLFVEMSLIPLYAGEPLIGDVITMLYDKGFALRMIEPEFIDRSSGHLLQVNGLFSRI